MKQPKRKNLPEGKIVNGEVGFMGPKNVPANPRYDIRDFGDFRDFL